MAYNKRILSEIDRELKDRYRSKRYSKSLAATNSLFAVNDLFAKPSRRRIYNPNAQYFQDGGVAGKYTMNVLFSNPPKYQIIEIETGKPLKVYTDIATAQAALEKLNGGFSKNIDPGFNPKPSNRPSGRQIDPGFGPMLQHAKYFKHGGPHDPPEKSKSLDEVTVTGSRKDPPNKYYDKNGNLIKDIPSYGTIYTSDPNDPKIQEFKDRLDLYNLSKKNYLDTRRGELDSHIKGMRDTIDYWYSINEPQEAKEPEEILEKLIQDRKNISSKDYLSHYRNQKGGYDVSETDLFDDILSGNFDEYKDYGKMLPDDMGNYTQKELDKIAGLYYSVGLDQKQADILKQGLKLGYKPYVDHIYDGGVTIDYPYPSLTVRYANPEKYDWAKPVEEKPEIQIDRLPIIEPSFISNPVTGEIITPEEDFNNDYKAKRVVDKETHYKVNKKGKIRRGPFGKKTTRRVRYELPEAQRGGVLKAIAKNSKKILNKKDLDVIKNAAKDYKKYAIKQSDITLPAIKEVQERLISAADPKSRTIMSGVEFTPDGKGLKIISDKKIQGSPERTFDILRGADEQMIEKILGDLKEEADLLKIHAEGYLENPYAIDLNRGDSIKFDEKGFLIEPLGGFYHGIGKTSPGFNLETLEFDRSKIDPEAMKSWTSTGSKHGQSQEYGFFGALNKNQGSQAALKYDGTRERAVMDFLLDPSKRPANLGAIKEIGLSPNARLVGGNNPYVINALRDVGISVTEMSSGVHIGGRMGMTPQKAAMLRSKYGIDGIVDLGGDELVIFNPDIISSVSDVPFKLFDYTNPLLQSLRQTTRTAQELENNLNNRFGTSYINPDRNQAYVAADHSWAVGGADMLGSMMDNANAYKAREILGTPGSYFKAGLRNPYRYGNVSLPIGLPFSEKWWKAAQPNLDLIRQRGGPINTSGPRAEEAPVDKDAMNAMMKARLAYEYERGNPAAKRMVAPVDNPYDFGDGRTGTHYMGSYGNYAIPEIQDVDGTLEMTGPRWDESMYFDRPEDAAYFANENYKGVSPMFINAELNEEEIQKYVDGGYIVEEMAEGGGVEVESCPPGQAWNGKYCVKIKNIVSDGKKIRVVPTPYEVENPSDDPLTQEFQSVDDIDSTIKQGKKQGYSDAMIDKMICHKGNCHVLTIDDDTEIEDIEPVKKRRPIEDIYPEVEPEIVEPEIEEEDLDIEPLPIIKPDLIINDIPEPIIEDEDIEDELPSAEEFYADSLPVTNSEGEIVLPYEETTGKYRKERRGVRIPGTKDRAWDGVKGNLQRIFTDKEYSGPWFPNLKRRIKQEGGVPKFQKGGNAIAKILKASASDIAGDALAHVISPLAYLSELRPNLSSLKPRFALSKSLKNKFQLEQDLASKDGSDFVNDWFYNPSSKVIRPEVAGKIRDIFKEQLSPAQFNQRKNFKTGLDKGEVGKWGVENIIDGEQVITNPDLLESMLTLDQSARYLDHPDNVLSKSKDLLVGTNSDQIIGNKDLNNYQKQYLLKKRFGIAGVNFSGRDDGPSVTLRNMGSYYVNPKGIAEVVVHEGGHSSQNLSNWIDQVQEWNPKKSTYYRAKDKGPGEHFKKVLWPNSGEKSLPNPFSKTTDYYGSVNELHSELMKGRFKVANEMAEKAMKKDGFTSKNYDDFQLQGLRKDYRIKAIEDLQNPSDQQIKQLIKAGSLFKHFKPGAKKADKYKAIRMLPGVGAAFALPSLMDDNDKPKLQKGGGISRPDIEYKSHEEIQDYVGGPSHGVDGYYDPTQNRVVVPPSATQDTLDHENFHAVQRGLGRMRVDPMTPKQEPSMLSSAEVANNYYNRHLNDVNYYFDNYADIVNPSSEQHERYLNVIPGLYSNPDIASKAPELVTNFNKHWPKDMDLMADEIQYRKAIEPLLYEDSHTMEGEAEYAARILGQRRADYAERHPESEYGFPIDMFDAIEQDGLRPTLEYIYTGKRQKGGALELGDEVTEDMVEELRRQGYTIEEI
jgi:hypothetical protein